jgi:iron complex transport system substrate-binding protein
VSLVPSVTEILFALGLGGRVVGVTDWCTNPPEAASKPKIGKYAEPSLEAVVAQAPDLVVASADSTKPAFVARLEAAGLPVYVVYPKSLAETARTMRDLGRVTGASREGEKLAADLEDAVRRAAGPPSSAGRRPRVLLCVSLRPLMVAGPKTLAGDLIRAVGAENVVPAGAANYPTWGMEAVLEKDPDVIVVSPLPGDPDPAQVFGPGRELRAVSGGRVVAVEADWLQRPGPRLSLGLGALSRAAWPREPVSQRAP